MVIDSKAFSDIQTILILIALKPRHISHFEIFVSLNIKKHEIIVHNLKLQMHYAKTPKYLMNPYPFKYMSS